MHYYKILPNISARWNGWRDRIHDYPNDETPTIQLRNVYLAYGDGQPVEDLVECASQFEQRVCNRAHLIIEKIREKWRARDGKLVATVQSLGKKLKMAEEKRDKAKTKFEQFSQEVEGDPAQHHVPRWAYVLLVSILGIAEFAMNIQVFTVFGAPQYETLLMALILSFSFPVAGHYLGRILRERPVSMPLLAVAVISCLIAGGAIYYMSRMRSVFFTLTAELGGEEFVHYSWLFFLFLNALVLVIATLASYYVHEEDEKMYKRRKALAKAEKDYEEATAQYNHLLDRQTDIEGKRNELMAHYQHEAEAVANRGQELISIYRTVNSRRKNPPTQIFNINPDIKVPPLFGTTQ